MESLIFIVLFLMAVFLILLVLVQRGRGGGLAGALGGPGGSSAFGAKAGDTFTKITVYAASIWIVTCIAASYWANNVRGDALGQAPQKPVVSSTVDLTGADDAAEGAAGAAGDSNADADEPATKPAESE